MHKNRNKAIALALALSLATTGCGTNKEYQNSGYEKIEQIMQDSDYYQKTVFNKTNEERYSDFYKTYYDTYIKYMSKEQYNNLLNVVTLMENNEDYETNIYRELNNMFNILGASKGRGLYASFNARILEENITLWDRYIGSISKNINTLRSLVNNDDEFFSCLYSNDIDKLIKCIMKNTGCKDKNIIEEIIYLMDAYYDICNSEEYMDTQVKNSYETRVEELIGYLVESKCATNEEFNNTLYATLLKSSAYVGESTYSVKPYLLDNTCNITIKENDFSYTLYGVNSDYLYQSITVEELKRLHTNDILSRCIINDEDDSYRVEDTMQLLLCLTNAEGFNLYTIKSSDDFRLFLYEDLKDYFSSEDEFNTFILRLYNGNAEVTQQYFELFIKRIKEDGITYEDFMRYASLVNYNDEAKFSHISWQGSYEEIEANYVPTSELKLMKESEYENIIWPMEENYFIGTIEYKDCFAEIDALLANNDLGFNRIYNPNCMYTWANGTVEMTNKESTNTLSNEVLPKSIPYYGSNIIYYEIPEGYEDALACELFPNYEGTLITRKVKGFKTTIEDNEGKEVLVFVAGIDASLDNYESIYFMQEYQLDKENNATLGLEGVNHE